MIQLERRLVNPALELNTLDAQWLKQIDQIE